jgi:putative SOS response-associated peptidase YedK
VAQRLHVADLDKINALLDAVSLNLPAHQFTPRYNIAGLSVLWLVRKNVASLELSPAIWGLIPPWAKPGQFPRPLTHARAETVFEKSSFKNLIRRYRGLVVVNGFYTHTTRHSRRPVTYYYSADNTAMALGALWQYNVDGNVELALLNTISERDKERLPVVIPASSLNDWLNSEKQNEITAMLNTDIMALRSYCVGDYIKDPLFEGPECIKEVINRTA